MAKSIFDLVDELDKHASPILLPYVGFVLVLTADLAFPTTTITRNSIIII